MSSHNESQRSKEPLIALTGEDPYRALLDMVEDRAIFLLDPAGRVTSWNTGAEHVKGYRADEIIGRHFSVFYPPEAIAQGYPDEELQRATVHGRWEDEDWRVRKDGSHFWADVVITALWSADGKLNGFAKVIRDLTERRRTEERLHQSEAQLRLLVDSVDDAIFLLDPQGYVTSWNAGATRLKGFEPSEIIGQHVSRFYPLEDIEARKPQSELATAGSLGRAEDEGWRLRKDGSRFMAHVVITAIYGPRHELLGFAKVTRDMTERNRLRQLEHSAELAAGIDSAGEAEKKRIARELHDDLGQQLIALKMDCITLAGESGPPLSREDFRHRLNVMRKAVDEAVFSVRRLAAGLRPTILDDLGLIPALTWLVDDFRARSGLSVTLRSDAGEAAFNDQASTAIFRIVQEGLSNVVRHAKGATQVVIELTCTTGMCDLLIHDNGHGTSSRTHDERGPRSSGLAGIRERTLRLGGTASIGAHPDGGFLIHLTVPRRSIE